MSDDNGTLFVLSVIGSPGTDAALRASDVLNHVIRPAAAQFGLTVHRADEDAAPGPITTAIIRSIISARVIVADMTGYNANVFYELGIADTLRKPVILLVDEVDKIPFDKKGDRAIVIGDGGKLGVRDALEAKANLQRALEHVLAEGYMPISLVAEAGAQSALGNSEDPTDLANGFLLELMDRVERLEQSDASAKTADQLEWLEASLAVLESKVGTLSALLPSPLTVAPATSSLSRAVASGSISRTQSARSAPAERLRLNSPAQRLKAGDKIEHKKYGPGTVVEVLGSGDKTEAMIDFGNTGVKRMLLAFSPVTKLEVDQDEEPF